MKLKSLALLFFFVVTSAPCSAETTSYTPVDVKSPPPKLLVPDLKVLFYSHKLPILSQQPAWSFVTDGFAKIGRPELIMTIVKRDCESDLQSAKDQPLMFFAQFSDLANQGNVIRVGGCTRFGEGADSSASKQFKGAIYLPVEKFEGVTLPKDALAVVPVTQEEMDAWDIGGAARVAGRLSQQSQFYPCPTWCDRDRASVFSQGEMQVMQMEPVSKAPTTMLYGAGIIADKDKLSMSVPKSLQADFVQKLKELPPDTAFRINLSIDPRANAYYVWDVQQSRAVAAKGSDASLMAGTFVLIMPGMPKTQFAPYKDGFILMLSDDDLKKFYDAISEGKDCVIESTTGGAYKTFEVKFVN